jgi:hypothetical protein
LLVVCGAAGFHLARGQLAGDIARSAEVAGLALAGVIAPAIGAVLLETLVAPTTAESPTSGLVVAVAAVATTFALWIVGDRVSPALRS